MKFKNTTKHKVSKQISTAMYTTFLLQPQKEHKYHTNIHNAIKKKNRKTYNIVVVFLLLLFWFFFWNSLFKCEKLIISINKFQYKVKRALIGQISIYNNKITFSFDLCPSNQILSRYLTKSIHTLFGYFLSFISDNSKKSCRIKDCQNFVNVDFKWYIYVWSTLKNF